MPSPTRAILLIAHGSRRSQANEELEQIAQALRQCEQFDYVQPAYLELTEPTIEQGAAACVAHGASIVILLPYFLSPGRHVVDDLSAACQRLRQLYPQTQFTVAPPLGQHPAIIDILRDHARIALAELDHPQELANNSSSLLENITRGRPVPGD
jgi:sirohydrochlorin ferrochelatase